MVTESRPYTDEEIAAEQAMATEILKQGRVETGQSAADMKEIPGVVKPMTYRISESDAGSWVMVWELKTDVDGQVYGKPTRAPRGQLGLWLGKTRADGGPRFTFEPPTRIAAEPQYPCLHQQCSKRLYTRQDMVEHVDNVHPRESRLFRSLLDEIMAKAAEDNPRVAEIARTIANTQERGVLSVEVAQAPRKENVDLTAGAPRVSTMGIKQATGCEVPDCGWKFKEGWSDAQRSQFLHTHTLMKHKEELE